MDTSPSTPQSTAIYVALITLAGSLVAGISATVGILVGRRLRQTSAQLNEAQANEADAHAVEMKASAVTSLIDQLMEQAKERQLDAKTHADQIRSHESTETYQRAMLNAYINRGHAVNGQLNYAVLYLSNLSFSLATAAERLKGMQNNADPPSASELTELIMLITPPPFKVKTQEEIDKQHPIPKAPAGVEAPGVETLVDSGEFRKPAI